MQEKSTDEYNEEIIYRIKSIMELADLEILGFSKITNISDSHIYSLLNGRRPLTDKMAKSIGKSLDFDGSIIFKLNKNIPLSISKSETLLDFKNKYYHNFEYFLSGKIRRKKSSIIEFEILPTHFFDNPKYSWEVMEECKKLKKNLSSNEIIGYLKYLSVRGLLYSEKRLIKLKSGQTGKRMVDVFWK